MLNTLCVLSSFSASLRLIRTAFAFAFSATPSRPSAATIAQYARGGIDRTFRGTQRHQPGQPCGSCVNSAPSSLASACHFGG